MNYSRQSSLFNPEKFHEDVHIIGCGATGSWVAMQLCKLGINKIFLYDFDIVEEHNLPNQMFRLSDVGKPKSQALKEILTEFRNSDEQQVIASNLKITKDNPVSLNGIVFCLVDSMEARSNIFKSMAKYMPNCHLWIETRMDICFGRIYALNPCSPNQIKEYEKTLYKDEDAAVSACGTSQSIASTASTIANLAVWKLIKYANQFHIDNELLCDLQNNNYISREF